MLRCMQTKRHVHNKWHKSTFYDRIYEQTISHPSIQWIRGKNYGNDTENKAPRMARIYWKFRFPLVLLLLSVSLPFLQMQYLMH